MLFTWTRMYISQAVEVLPWDQSHSDSDLRDCLKKYAYKEFALLHSRESATRKTIIPILN